MAQLMVKWTSDTFNERSRIARENRSNGVTKHTQGSVSSIHVYKKMEKRLKRPSTEIELHIKTHNKKGSTTSGEGGEGGKGEEMKLIDETARSLQYAELENELIEHQLSTQEPGTQLSEEQMSQIKSQVYLDAAGYKKGRVLGIGCATSLFCSRDVLTNNSSVSFSSANKTRMSKTEEEWVGMTKLMMQALTMHCRKNAFDRPLDDRRDPPPSPPAPPEQIHGF